MATVISEVVMEFALHLQSSPSPQEAPEGVLDAQAMTGIFEQDMEQISATASFDDQSKRISRFREIYQAKSSDLKMLDAYKYAILQSQITNHQKPNSSSSW